MMVVELLRDVKTTVL